MNSVPSCISLFLTVLGKLTQTLISTISPFYDVIKFVAKVLFHLIENFRNFLSFRDKTITVCNEIELFYQNKREMNSLDYRNSIISRKIRNLITLSEEKDFFIFGLHKAETIKTLLYELNEAFEFNSPWIESDVFSMSDKDFLRWSSKGFDRTMRDITIEIKSNI